MKFAIKLDQENRIQYASYAQDAYGEMVFVESLPKGNLSDYKYINGEYVYDPEAVENVQQAPNQLDLIEAQVFYTAMMTDTLLEE